MTSAFHRRVSSFPLFARRRVLLLVSLAVLVIGGSGALFSCSQTPTEVPVRTFERAQRMDVVCMRLYDPPTAGNALNAFTARAEPIGRPEADCPPVPADGSLDGSDYDKQLFALVTQTQRGELAVVDLTSGQLVDTKRAIPGINFLPVGANPTGVAVTPDGKMAFVASGETNKPAIYAVPTRRLLGDTVGFTGDPTPLTIDSWPVCALPQNPGAILVVPRPTSTTPAVTTGDIPPAYDIVVVLPGDRLGTAKLLTLDPRPFRRGGLPTLPDGSPDYNSPYEISQGDNDVPTLGPSSLPGGDTNPAAIMKPGALATQPCSLVQESAIELVGGEVLPASLAPAVKWEDGVKYVDGGVDLTCDKPNTTSTTCTNTPCCAPEAISDEAGLGVVDPTAAAAAAAAATDAGTCVPLGTADAGNTPLALGQLDPPHIVAMARADQYVYIADNALPLIHVIDTTDPTAPKEVPPLLATSVANPQRVVTVQDLAVSPPTRDYRRFLYGIDKSDGSLMVYDITDPLSAQREPQQKPHPELNPFEAIDRITFAGPVVSVAFAQHDVPLQEIDGIQVPSAASGILCNPNPNLDPAANGGANPSDLGYYYRNDSTDPGQTMGPRRLRGVFALATLSNGNVTIIDVDDWDAPCRRPVFMDHNVSDLGVAEPAAASLADTDPYHAPQVDPLAVLDEAYFPVSAPHTLRSSLPFTNDDTNGINIPRLVENPIIVSNGITLSQVGDNSAATPLISPVTFGFESPQVQTDQDWFVTYEGQLVGFTGLTAIVTTNDNYSSLQFTQAQAHFCKNGVEDLERGKDRVNAANAELALRGTSLETGIAGWTTDYISMNEDLLDVTDQYWTLNQACWDGALTNAPGNVRHDECAAIYGSLASDEKPSRDFPIIEAYDDHLVLGRFYTPAQPLNSHRQVVYADPSNAADLKLMQCCFHNAPQFTVRTGGEWSVIGNTPGQATGLGFFSHLTEDSAGRCVQSCDPRDSLLNGRVVTLPYSTNLPFDSLSRESTLVMRNPLFTFAMSTGTDGSEPVRDSQYTFSAIGGFIPLTISIAGGTTDVNPQSMRYIDSLGQMAVVDGASQGLNLIDLQNVVIAHAPYF